MFYALKQLDIVNAFKTGSLKGTTGPESLTDKSSNVYLLMKFHVSLHDHFLEVKKDPKHDFNAQFEFITCWNFWHCIT